jgi:hypothetical protein
MNTKVQDLISQIKARAAGLEFMEDGLAFDKYLGELDSLLYELRTVAWKLPEGVKAYKVDNMDQWLDELAEELNDEQWKQRKTQDVNRD